MDNHPDHIKYQAKSKEANEWSNRQAALRKELVASLPSVRFTDTGLSAPRPQSQRLGSLLVAGLPAVASTEAETISDSKLASLQLSGALKDLQNEWRRAGEESERAMLEAGKPNMYFAPYANVLQKPHPSVNPITPQWSAYGWPWTASGLAAGLIAGLVFYRMRAWKPVDDSAPVLPTATAVEF